MAREVVLVDGVGRPKLHEIPDGPDWPATISYADLDSFKRRPTFWYFKFSANEVGPENRPIYRLMEYTHAPLRLEPDYLRKSTLRVPQLRLEEPKKPHQGNCE